MNEDEEREFWANHDSTKFIDWNSLLEINLNDGFNTFSFNCLFDSMFPGLQCPLNLRASVVTVVNGPGNPLGCMIENVRDNCCMS
jgi:hypothetical protein